MKDFSYVTGPGPAYIESLYNEFAKDSSTVDPEWKKFFEGFDFAMSSGTESSKGSVVSGENGVRGTESGERVAKEIGVFELIRAYRRRGHLAATTNPIRARK